MRMRNTQFDLEQRSVSHGPLVVYGQYKNRDGPLIYHLRDGPLFNTGPPRGTGPPAGTGPPIRHGPPGRTGPQHETGPPNGHGPPFEKKQAGVEFESTKVKEKQNINLIREETKMKHFKLKRLIGLAIAGMLSALHAPTVFATAGDTIGNTATLNFTVGGGPALVLESDPAGNTTTGPGAGNPTQFLEDRVINFTVATVDGGTITVAPNSTDQVQTFTVTNSGNGIQDFLLVAVNNTNNGADPFGGGNDDINPVTNNVFVETVNPGGYLPADDTSIFIDELAPGASVTVYIVSSFAGAPPLVDGNIAVMSLVAQVAEGLSASGDDTQIVNAGAEIIADDNSHVSPGGTFGNPGQTRVVAAGVAATNPDGLLTEEVVFNDPAGAAVVDQDGTATNTQDVALNAQHSDSSSYTVAAAALTVTKTAALWWDPVNGEAVANDSKSILGAYVQYTITVSNTGTASADLTTLGDTLPNTPGVGGVPGAGALELDANLIQNNGVPPALGAAESALGDGIRVDTTGMAGRADAAVTYCTGTADADGCDYAGGVGGTLTLDFTTIAAFADDTGGVGTHTVGELEAGESFVIVFNAIVR